MPFDFSKFTAPPQPYGAYPAQPTRKNILLDVDCTLIYTYIFRPDGYTDDPERWFVNILTEPSGESVPYYTLIRPLARHFVSALRSRYNVFFFTAGDREYAEPIFDNVFPEVPPENRFYRDSCQPGEHEDFVKDLRQLPIALDLRHTILLDDHAPGNTIPPENGMFCAQFAPPEENDSPDMIDNLMTDYALGMYLQLLCSDHFLASDDVRREIHEFTQLTASHYGRSHDDS